LVEPGHAQLSVRRQCALLGLNRSSWYYEPVAQPAANLALMRLLDEQYLRTPFYGSRRMTAWLRAGGHDVNRKRVQRLMRLMGLEAIYPKPRTTSAGVGHKVYPYLLRSLEVTGPDQVWGADITYIPLRCGFLYLMAILDWYSRYVLAWRLSNSLDTDFCLEALDEALRRGRPEIFNTDQGVQFTSQEFTERLEAAGVAISMDGKGRALDNVFVERLWRTVKYEEVYLKDYATGVECYAGLKQYLRFYCEERLHQSLGYRTPAEVYRAKPRARPGQRAARRGSRRGGRGGLGLRSATRRCAPGRSAPPSPPTRRRDHRGGKAQGAYPGNRRIRRLHFHLSKPHSWSKEWGPLQPVGTPTSGGNWAGECLIFRFGRKRRRLAAVSWADRAGI
jgi:putative transposase